MDNFNANLDHAINIVLAMTGEFRIEIDGDEDSFFGCSFVVRGAGDPPLNMALLGGLTMAEAVAYQVAIKGAL